jgi:hypothetical protein
VTEPSRHHRQGFATGWPVSNSRLVASLSARRRSNTKAAELNKEEKKIDPVDIDPANAGFAPPLDVLLLSGSEAVWGSAERGPVQGSTRLRFQEFGRTPSRRQEFLLSLRPACSGAKMKLRNRAYPILRGLPSATSPKAPMHFASGATFSSHSTLPSQPKSRSGACASYCRGFPRDSSGARENHAIARST